MAKDAGGKSKQIQASKAQAKAAKGGEGGKGGKAKKKKWSKGRVREKLNNAVLFEQAILDKLTNEVPKWKLITPSVVVDRLKVNGSLARQGLDYLEKEGLIKRVAHHNMNRIYTRTTAASKAAADEEEAEAKPKKDVK